MCSWPPPGEQVHSPELHACLHHGARHTHLLLRRLVSSSWGEAASHASPGRTCSRESYVKGQVPKDPRAHLCVQDTCLLELSLIPGSSAGKNIPTLSLPRSTPQGKRKTQTLYNEKDETRVGASGNTGCILLTPRLLNRGTHGSNLSRLLGWVHFSVATPSARGLWRLARGLGMWLIWQSTFLPYLKS